MSTGTTTTVRVGGDTHDRIDANKREGETADDVIARALDALEGDVVPTQDIEGALEQLGGAVSE